MARADVWAQGNLYEPYVGRWSRLVARHFLEWLAVPAGREWLDVGCGTGALTQAILTYADPKHVMGVDPSEGFVEYARSRTGDERARFETGDAQSLPLPAGSVDAVVSGLVLNFVPEPARAVEEMNRVVRPRGIVAAYVWDYAGRMDLIRVFWDAAMELNPAARDLDEGPRFPICQAEPLREVFARAGLGDVEVRAIDVPTDFQNFDDFWNPFLGGQGPAPGYAMSLNEAGRNALRDRIRSKLPIQSDGSIHLIARAWAALGRSAPGRP